VRDSRGLLERGRELNEKTTSKESGQSLVLVAAAMVILVLFVAITVDVSSAYYNRRTAQNAADGAALAGVSRMATQINKKNARVDDEIKEDMNDFAERNGIADTDEILANDVNNNVDGWYVDTEGNRLAGEPMVGEMYLDRVPDGAFGIEAITYITAPTYFGGIFGLDGLALEARAVSLLKQACGSNCVVPITTDVSLLLNPDGSPRIGQCFNIWRESQTGNETDPMTPGLYGWVSWTWQRSMCTDEVYGDGRPCPEVDQKVNGCDAGVLENNLDPSFCASGFIKVGDWMSSTSGKVNADDVRCLLDYYLGIPHPIDECGVSSDVQHEFTIPVYDVSTAELGGSSIPCLLMGPPYDGTSGGLHYRVAGFARMQILGYQLSQGTSEEVNVGHSGVGCTTVGEVPNNGSRITAEFRDYVQDIATSDECYDPSGTLLSAPRLNE
jgi:hypothetical protein